MKAWFLSVLLCTPQPDMATKCRWGDPPRMPPFESKEDCDAYGYPYAIDMGFSGYRCEERSLER